MTDAARPTPRLSPPRIFNAPLLVVVMALLLVALHAVFSFASVGDQDAMLFDFALAPQRFWAPAGSPDVYPDHISGLMTLISMALLHANWMHLLINVLLLLVFGAPVARAFGNTVTGWGIWMILFLGSVAAGSALYLALATVGSPFVVGASGGVFGLTAAAVLLDGRGRKRALWSREFLTITAIVGFADFAFASVSQFLVGLPPAWEVHAGGYITGAILMAVLPAKGLWRAES